MTAPPAVVALLAFLCFGCSTRVVDLALPPEPAPEAGPADAAAIVRCEDLVQAMAVCKVCYDTTGRVVESNCAPNAGSMDPGAANAGNRATAICKVGPTGTERCRQCSDTYGQYTACVKCETDFAVGDQGDRCRSCTWNDLPNTRCLQCFDANRGLTQDDCDALRRDKTDPTPIMTPTMMGS